MLSKKHLWACCALIFVVLGTLIFPVEEGGESWGYWHFTKLLKEDLRFIMLDRSPLYTLYLLPFSIFNFPWNMDLVFLVTSSILVFAIYYFFQSYNRLLAVLIASLYHVLLLGFEPVTQKLALAFVLIAVQLRIQQQVNRSLVAGSNLVVFYALLWMASMMRGTFRLVIFAFIFYDLWRVAGVQFRKKWFFIKLKSLKRVIGRFKLLLKGRLNLQTLCIKLLPLLVLFLLTLVFNFRQSNHPWNNAWLAETDWIPQTSQSLADIAIIGHMAWHTGSLVKEGESKDIYFTHPQFFGDAKTAREMIQKRPDLYIHHFIGNKHRLHDAFLYFVGFNEKNAGFLNHSPINFLYNIIIGIGRSWLVLFALMAFAILPCFREAERSTMSMAFVAMALATVFIFPKARYVSQIFTVFCLGAIHLFLLLRWANKNFVQKQFWNRVMLVATIVLAGGLGFFISGQALHKTMRLTQIVMDQYKQGLSVASIARTNHEFSMRTHYQEILQQLPACRGIMAIEHNFFAAFSSTSPDIKVASIFSLPPFGSYTPEQNYGLGMDRINCLFISKRLENGVGMGTTQDTRLRDYILPYEKVLIKNGAVRYEYKNWGRLIVLPAAVTQ